MPAKKHEGKSMINNAMQTVLNFLAANAVTFSFLA